MFEQFSDIALRTLVHVKCRLHTVFAFTRPAVSQDLGKDMAQWQQQVLKTLAAPDSDDALVSQVLAQCA